MTHAHPALRKGPKWLVTPGVFVLLAVSLLAVPSVRAPFEDHIPDTQEFARGSTNDTFPGNITTSDDTFIYLHAENTSTPSGPVAWRWFMRVFYNWTGTVDTTGSMWELIVECVSPPHPLVGNMTVTVYDTDTSGYVSADNAVCLTADPISHNLTTTQLNGGNVSVRLAANYVRCNGPADPQCAPQNDWTWDLDQVIIRRVYTVTPPALPSPLLDWMLILILLILWVSFSAIGLAKPSGLLFMGGALCGIILAFFFMIPVAVLPGIAVLGLAMTCMLGGAGIAISSGGEAG